MPQSSFLMRLASITFIAGGFLLFFSTEFAYFPYALFLCILGSLLILRQTARSVESWQKETGTGSLLGALLCVLFGITGQSFPLIVTTSTRYDQTGNAIDVINYPLSYFTDRYGSLPAFLLLSIGLYFLQPSVRATIGGVWRRRLLLLLAFLSSVLFLAGAVDVYLDGIAPQTMVNVLWRMFAIGWLILGGLIIAGEIGKSSSSRITQPQ